MLMLWPAAGLGAWTVAVHAWDLLKEVTIMFITSAIVWPQVNSTEGTQLHPSIENWIKDFLSMACHQNKLPQDMSTCDMKKVFHANVSRETLK